MSRNPWNKGILEWTEGETAYLSLPFTWLLPRAYQLAVFYRAEGYTVRAGGPGVMLRPDYLAGVAQVGGEVPALARHNPLATRTSRGCIRQCCSFCAVPRLYPNGIEELAAWEPRPIVCDDNLLACSTKHFDRVIDRLRGIKGVDFNQGLDARLLTGYHAGRLREMDLDCVRFAWDDIAGEAALMDSLKLVDGASIPRRIVRCYVLVGMDDTPDDALYRCERLKALGITMNVQRYQPLTALKRNEFVGPNWTAEELRRFCRFWNRQAWLGGIRYEDYEG